MISPVRSISKRSKDINLIQEQALLIESLEKKVDSTSTKNFYKLTSLNLPERVTPDKKAYAKDLLYQIEENYKRSAKSKLKKQESSDIEALCSLKLPTTPDQVRREREKIKQLKVKRDLESQIGKRVSYFKTEKDQKLEDEKKDIFEKMKKIEIEEQEKSANNRREKELLVQSWKHQIRYKELQGQVNLLESTGFNPRSRSVFNKKEIAPSPMLEITKEDQIIVKENLAQIKLSRPMKKVSYIEKANFLKTNLEEKYKNSVQFKIKKILQNIKSNRKINSTSLSPERFLSNKRLIFNN